MTSLISTYVKFLFIATLFGVAYGTSAASLYTPTSGPCPANFSLYRLTSPNQALSPDEASYVSSRNSAILPSAWASYLANVPGAPLPGYVTAVHPALGVAVSGGGWRAAIFGAGALNALDGRNASAAAAGTGGLLQAATYLAGLSGGAWLVTSLVQADFPTIQELVYGVGQFGGWLPQYSLALPSGDLFVDVAYLAGLFADVQGKYGAGFPVTAADIWARILARHFLNGTSGENFFDTTVPHGAGLTLSGVAQTDTFKAFAEPFPIVIADSRSDAGNQSNVNVAGGASIPLTNPIYEFNPYEMGSYDPMLAAFAPAKYLGTRNTSVCVTGFDQLGFVQATSSNIFSSYNTTNLTSLLDALVSTVGPSGVEPGIELDAAVYPNPFYGLAPGTYIDSNQTYLSLVDGGFDTESIPLQPLLVKARGVEVILAIDATADVDGFAAGSPLIVSQNRTKFFPSSYSFPPVPNSVDDFISENLTTHPTFFGCNSSAPTPLIIYLPNGAPPPGQPALTNTSSNQIQYSASEVQAMLDQTFEIATAAGVDNEWPACLACAVADRARERLGAVRGGVCASCMARYCWS
ncbi:lysophospholipase [Neolentinus lepideus HHB14362 ss-1]|uniref:Lysophospholipase n=1 Tax=Neolentinus lepideus HHB14362 ss-1 TaxID=1314782 RepID=A0A165V5Y3_9AGAM|nr:lysophospholipase [Neolentinus lepideus HHB14362 ss-1]